MCIRDSGTVNNMHDTLTPLGGLVPLLHMMLNCVFGGKGVGLMNMVMYVILAVFICGLMVGRTPEYLNKKIEGKEMKLVAICILIHPLLILGFSALAVAVPAGLEGDVYKRQELESTGSICHEHEHADECGGH